MTLVHLLTFLMVYKVQLLNLLLFYKQSTYLILHKGYQSQNSCNCMLQLHIGLQIGNQSMQFKCLQIFLAQMVISINIAKCKTTFFSCIDGNLFDSNDLLLWFSIFPCKLRDRKSYFPFWISEPMFRENRFLFSVKLLSKH